MIKVSQDKEFHCHTCINSTARCNRMALEINTEWNVYNKKNNYTAKTDNTLAVGPKNKRDEIKHVYKDIDKRWNKKTYIEDELTRNKDNISIKHKSFNMYQNAIQKK